MHDDTTKLIASVSATRSLMAGAAALIAGLGQRIRDALDNDDTPALNALADELTSGPEATALAAAIAENTPAADIAEHEDGTAVILPPGSDTGTAGGSAGGEPAAPAADDGPVTQDAGGGADTVSATEGLGASDDETGDDADLNTQ